MNPWVCRVPSQQISEYYSNFQSDSEEANKHISVRARKAPSMTAKNHTISYYSLKFDENQYLIWTYNPLDHILLSHCSI